MAFSFITLSSNSQTTDSTTGNLTNFTGSPTDTTSVWNNAGSVGQPLTCWAPGGQGYCGPNPRVSAWGAGSNVINFSYGTVDLNQVVNINKALAIGGSGVQLSGFNFGFTAKNGNGWDDGRQDYLSAYVKLYGSSGNQVTSYDYTNQTNRRYGWTNFNFNETFVTPYTASSLSNIQYGFVGRDNNFWVGPYGPEIINVNFSLKYSVKPDPCIADPLSSPTCPGYALATVKNSILGSIVSNASATSYMPSTNYSSPAPAASGIAEASPALAQVSPQQQTQPQAQSNPMPTQQDANKNPSVAQDNPAQPSPTQQGPASTTPQPAGGPPQTVTASAPQQSSGPSGSGSGPSKLAMSVVKTAQANDKATQNAAVQNAAKTLENATQNSQASSNAAISMNQDMSANSATAAATFASQYTQTSIQASVQTNQQTTQSNVQQTQQSSRVTQQAQQDVQVSTTQSNNITTSIQQFIYTPPVQQQENTQSTQIAILKPPASVVVEVQQQSSNGNGLIVSRNLFAYNPLIASPNTTNMSTPLPTIQPMYQPKLDSIQYEVETPQYQISSFSGVGKAGNPLSEIIMQQRFELMQNNITQPTSSVNRNVLPNELAGGIDIASIASIPTGFNAYSFVLKDASFYEIKEVYKNQRTVDNERVLRGLTRGSDSLHQQMVDQQYKLGQ